MLASPLNSIITSLPATQHRRCSSSNKSSFNFNACYWRLSRGVAVERVTCLCFKASDFGNVGESSNEKIGREGGDRSKTSSGSIFSSKELLQKLRTYGVAGVLSYGLLNTVYYLITFLLVWFYFAPAPGKMGYSAAVERFLKVMAMVWAGSQVTKILRAGGALALAPFVARGLTWFTKKFSFESEGKAFAAIASLCFGVAALLFFVLTLLWA